ncbi:OmpA family protein [Reichenbachiella versicolor]|uniref:OmpA family protein n=1 Tax=Reichenbachiella versicolor TaxID=1821036 RepID=UPI000D6DFC8E|nr:OmpA family protein [Reichenbachiella versicolor]
MRKSNFLLAALTGLVLLSGCSSLNKMIKLAEQQQLDIVPSPLELHGDSIKYSASAVLPAKMLPEGYSFIVTNYYKYGESDLEVGKMTFDASDFPESKTTTSKKEQSFSFAYADGMQNGDLEVIGMAVDPKGENKSTARKPMAKGLIVTSLMVEDVVYAAYAASGYTDEEELEPTNVEFYFDRGSSVLKWSEKSGSKGKEFSAFIADKNVTRTVTITGTHSPEGSETVNTGLSESRAKAIEKYYRAQMRKYDYKGMADSIEFILKPVVEDWTEFKTKLDAYEGVSDEQKSEIVKVVNGQGTFEDKEKALQKLDSYNAIFKDIYPGLRAAKTEVLTVIEKKTNAEIAALAKQIVAEDTTAALSTPELLFAATLTPDLDEKEAIYMAATKQEASWVAHNNLGAVYIEKAKMAEGSEKTSLIEKAIAQLDIAAQKENAVEVQANKASALVLQGDKAQAYDAVTGALAAGAGSHQADLYGVKGSIEIKLGDYTSASASLNGAQETTKVAFNKGLAALLKKDYDNANTGFDSAIELDSEFTKAYYAKAVTAAREGKAEELVKNLKTAVEKDPSLKEKALADLEFREFASQLATALN